MTQVNQNVHILLPEEDLKMLRAIANRENQSVGEMIRKAIRKVYRLTDRSTKMKILGDLQKHSELQMVDWETVKQDLLKRYE
jgi:predicted transcriptional regulator